MGGLGGGLEEGAITKDEQETTPGLSLHSTMDSVLTVRRTGGECV